MCLLRSFHCTHVIAGERARDVTVESRSEYVGKKVTSVLKTCREVSARYAVYLYTCPRSSISHDVCMYVCVCLCACHGVLVCVYAFVCNFVFVRAGL